MSTAAAQEDTHDMKGFWASAVRWLFGQEAIVVVLFAIMGMIGFGGYYAITKAIPSHLDSIQGGYDRMAVAHKDEVLGMSAAHGKQAEQQGLVFKEVLNKQADTHEKTMTRIADSFDKTMDAALKRAEAKQ